MAFSPDRYLDALTFAAHAHGEQKTPMGLPYLVHVTSVTMEVIAALRTEPGRDEDLAVTCALLHDVAEDTTTTLREIELAFGGRVASGVSALTKNPKLPKPHAMADSLRRILEQPPEIAMVKLADRVTNLAPPPQAWSTEKIATYREEARAILSALGGESPVLAARLQARIDTYPAAPAGARSGKMV